MDTGMRQFVDQDQVAGARKRRDDAGIGEVAGTEYASGLGRLEPRQTLFQFAMERMVAGDQPRSAGADAMAFGGFDRGLDDGRVLTKIEIVVAGKRQQPAAAAFGENAVAQR